MPKLYLGEALTLLGKTLPFIWVRLGSYAVLGLGLLVYFGVLAGIGLLLGRLWAPLGFIFFLIAIGGAFAIIRWASRYYFHLLRAAHTAVMTEFIVYGRGPDGGQLAYGRKAVMDRFTDTSILFAVDVLVEGAVKAFVRTFARVASILPIPGMRGFGNLVERVALMSTTYVDEAVLSRAYKEREQSVWKVAYDGVLLYAQAWKPILTNAVVLTLIGYVEFVLLLVILGIPALAIAAVFPGLSVALGVFVLVGAWMIKLAVADAFSLAATLIAYHRSTEGMTPNEEWKAKLEGVSDRFRELGQKAVADAGRRSGPAASMVPGTTGTPDGPGAPPAAPTPEGPAAPDASPPPAPPSAPPTGDAPDGPAAPPTGEPNDPRERS